MKGVFQIDTRRPGGRTASSPLARLREVRAGARVSIKYGEGPRKTRSFMPCMVGTVVVRVRWVDRTPSHAGPVLRLKGYLVDTDQSVDIRIYDGYPGMAILVLG